MVILKQRIWTLPIFSLIIMLVFIAGMAVVYSINRSTMEQLDRISSVYVPVKNALSSIREHTIQLQNVFRDAVAVDDLDVLEELPHHAEMVRANLTTIVESLPDDDSVIALRDLFDKYFNSASMLAKKFTTSSMTSLMKEMNEVNIYREHFDEHISTLEMSLEKNYKNISESAQKQLQKMIVIVFIMVFLLISVLAVGSFVITRKLSGRLSVLTEFAQQIQQGRYDKTIDAQWNDEFSVVANAFNSMVKSIREATEKLSRLANYDSLTEVYSRSALINQLEANIQSVRRHKFPLTFCMCDVDKFKVVNDTYGHELGDKVLEAFASYLKTVLRTEDIIGRYGGDEFCVILPHTKAETAKVALERVKSCLEDQVFSTYAGDTFSVTCSFGVAEFHHDMDKTLLMRAADEALYLAKQNGRNRVEIKAWQGE